MTMSAKKLVKLLTLSLITPLLTIAVLSQMGGVVLGVEGHDDVLTSHDPATCEVAGQTSYTCTRCERIRTVSEPALGHDYVLIVQNPTCDIAGQSAYICSRCGHTHSETELAPLGHDYVLMVRNPTCEISGQMTYTCSRCDYTSVEPGETALGHDYVLSSHEPATCEAPDHSTYTCSRCDFESTDSDEMTLGHDYVLTIQEATCEEAGLRFFNCSRCNNNLMESGEAALGHDYVVTIQNPTCKEHGFHIYACSYCDNTYTETREPLTACVFGAWITKTPADVDVEGVEVRSCIGCNGREERAIPPLPAPLFNEIDVIAGSASMSFSVIFLIILLPIIRVISREKKAYQAYLVRKRALEAEDQKHDFH